MPGIVAEAPPAADEARRGWRSGRNFSALQAETNFGHRKRGCEATSKSFCPCKNRNGYRKVSVLFLFRKDKGLEPKDFFVKKMLQ